MEVGSPGDVIVTLARQQNADLVVMGARGKGPIKERFLGSVSHRVLSMAACATLIVNRPMQRIHRILLALQGPEDAEAAVRFLASTPFREPAEVTIVTVVPFVPPAWPAEVSVADATKEKALLNAQDFVDDVAYRLTRPGYNVRALAIVASPIQVILNEAAKVKPDLILIGSHRDRDVARLELGSTARAVLHQGATPVLVFQ
jgi:nucleotide-binding universal stress UspA family protein